MNEFKNYVFTYEGKMIAPPPPPYTDNIGTWDQGPQSGLPYK
jgi:hypothetical protein